MWEEGGSEEGSEGGNEASSLPAYFPVAMDSQIEGPDIVCKREGKEGGREGG